MKRFADHVIIVLDWPVNSPGRNPVEGFGPEDEVLSVYMNFFFPEVSENISALKIIFWLILSNPVIIIRKNIIKTKKT